MLVPILSDILSVKVSSYVSYFGTDTSMLVVTGYILRYVCHYVWAVQCVSHFFVLVVCMRACMLNI